MGKTRTTLSRRARGILSAALIGLLALGGGAALVLSSAASPAYADPGDVMFTTAPGTGVPHSPYTFTGVASPGDAVTITSAVSDDCHTVAVTDGSWSCDVVFTDSIDYTNLTVTRDVDDNNPYTFESDTQQYSVALPIVINETQPGQVLSNDLTDPVTGHGAWPGADIIATIGGIGCFGPPADVNGDWSCTPPVSVSEGTHGLLVQQEVGTALSDAVSSNYVYDITGPMYPKTSFPYDSTMLPINIATSDTTPLIGGDPGTAEPTATVHVLATDFGTTPPTHTSGIPAFDLWCDAVVNSDGAWSCTGAPMTVGHFWEVSVWSTDLAGNTGASPDDEFAIEILPPPPPPVVVTPLQDFGELSPIKANGTVDDTVVEVRVMEGEAQLCSTVPVGIDWSCPPDVGPGAHTLEFIAYDVYGTPSTSVFRDVTAWPQPSVDTPWPGMHTSAPTITVTGDAPIGADVSVRVDGSALCSPVPFGDTHFSCETNFLSVGNHTVDVDYTDPWGTTSETVSRGITILPQADAPTLTLPVIGYQSPNRVVHVSGLSFGETTVYVREGAFDLCPPIDTGQIAFSCNTVPLSVGTHTISVTQLDPFGQMSLAATRTVTILAAPTPPDVLMKTFGFTFRVLGADGNEIGTDGLGTGDTIRIEATGVPAGTLIEAEIHSTPIHLGSQTVGQSGEATMVTTVPAVEPGSHQIVLSASGPGYWPAAFSTPVEVHGLKWIPDDQLPTLAIKEMGDPVDTTDPEDATGPGGSDGGLPPGTGGGGIEDPTVFGSALSSPFDAEAHAFALTVGGIALSGTLALAFLLLVSLPAELLESTIRSNYDRAFGWMARLRRHAGRILAPIARAFANPWVGSGVTILAAAVLLGFADPGFGFNGASVRLTIAMIVSVLTINIGLSLIVMRVARQAFDVKSLLRPMPAALVLVGISVLVSRLAGISPGFLFGIVLGVMYLRELKLRDEGRLGALLVGLTLAAGLLAWLGYGIASTASGPGFWNNLLIESFAAITLEALGTMIVALLPIDFLDGRTIFRWSKPVWLGLYLVTALVFLFVVVPMSGNWGVMSAPVFGWGTLFVVFAIVAFVTWALFERFPKKKVSSAESATVASGSAEKPQRPQR